MFGQNHGLTSLENLQLLTRYHACFSSQEMIVFSREHQTLFQCVLKFKTKHNKIHIFGQN